MIWAVWHIIARQWTDYSLTMSFKGQFGQNFQEWMGLEHQNAVDFKSKNWATDRLTEGLQCCNWGYVDKVNQCNNKVGS